MEAGGSSSAPSEGAGGSAPPTREELHILFTRGVRCILGRWEVMTAAMQDGGGDSGKHPAQLFAELERETLINFDERWERSEAVDVGEVGDFLNDFVTEELGYDVAPSIYAQVAKVLVHLYNDCLGARTKDVAAFVEKHESEVNAMLSLPAVGTPAAPYECGVETEYTHASDSGEDDEEGEDEEAKGDTEGAGSGTAAGSAAGAASAGAAGGATEGEGGTGGGNGSEWTVVRRGGKRKPRR